MPISQKFNLLFCSFLITFVINPIGRLSIKQQEKITASSISVSLFVYLLNKSLNKYERLNPKSYIPIVSKLFFVHPIKIGLILAGLLRIRSVFKTNSSNLVNNYAMPTESQYVRIKNKLKARTNEYMQGVFQVLTGLLLTYFCYKDI